MRENKERKFCLEKKIKEKKLFREKKEGKNHISWFLLPLSPLILFIDGNLHANNSHHTTTIIHNNKQHHHPHHPWLTIFLSHQPYNQQQP